MHLRCVSGHSGLPRSVVQTKSRTVSTPSLRQRPDLALLIEGWIPFDQGTTSLLRSDGKRPDGLTLIPWRDGRCATWDVTVTDTVAASYLNATSSAAGSAAEAAASRKEAKYAAISANYLFFPLAFENFWPINQAGCDFLSSLGQRLFLISDDPRESSFLFQRLSVAPYSASILSFFINFLAFGKQAARALKINK